MGKRGNKQSTRKTHVNDLMVTLSEKKLILNHSLRQYIDISIYTLLPRSLSGNFSLFPFLAFVILPNCFCPLNFIKISKN